MERPRADDRYQGERTTILALSYGTWLWGEEATVMDGAESVVLVRTGEPPEVYGLHNIDELNQNTSHVPKGASCLN